MTTLHKLFVRTHVRYIRSPHVEDLADFARWLLERAYTLRYAQNLVFGTMRVLDRFDLPPGSTWTSDQLDRAFRPYWHRPTVSGRTSHFGRLPAISRADFTTAISPGPHTPVWQRIRDYLADVRGLLPTTVSQHLAEVHALVQYALPTGKSLKLSFCPGH